MALVTEDPKLGSAGAGLKWAPLATMLLSDPDNMRLRIELFDRALEAGAFEAANSALSGGLAAEPSDPAWQHRQALLAMAQGRWDEAVGILQTLIEGGHTSAAIRYNLAYVLFALGQFSTAAKRLAPLMDKPEVELIHQALTLRLRCLQMDRKLEEGIALYTQFEAQCSTAPSTGVAALIALDAGRLDLAELWAAQALAQDSTQHDALVAMGSVLLGRRDAKHALEFLQRAEVLYANDGRTLSGLGLAHLMAFDFSAARAALMLAVKAMPDHVGTWHSLGWCEMFQHNLEAAGAAFERAIELDHNFGESHGGLAVVLAQMKKTDLARESLRRAERLPGANLGARYAAAILDGEDQDLSRFDQMARRILFGQRDAEGNSLTDVLLRR